MSKFINAIDTLVSAMINSDAENYNQHLVAGGDGVDYVVTVQIKDGLTPCEKLAEAEVKIAKLTKDVGLLRKYMLFIAEETDNGALSILGVNAAANKALSET